MGMKCCKLRRKVHTEPKHIEEICGSVDLDTTSEDWSRRVAHMIEEEENSQCEESVPRTNTFLGTAEIYKCDSPTQSDLQDSEPQPKTSRDPEPTETQSAKRETSPSTNVEAREAMSENKDIGPTQLQAEMFESLKLMEEHRLLTRRLFYAEIEKNKRQAVEIERLKEKSEQENAAFQAAMKQKDSEINKIRIHEQDLKDAVGSLHTRYNKLVEAFVTYRSMSEEKHCLIEETLKEREESLRLVQTEDGELKEKCVDYENPSASVSGESKSKDELFQSPANESTTQLPNVDRLRVEIGEIADEEKLEESERDRSRTVLESVALLEEMLRCRKKAELEKTQLETDSNELIEPLKALSGAENLESTQQLENFKGNQEWDEQSTLRTTADLETRLYNLRNNFQDRDTSTTTQLESLLSENREVREHPALSAKKTKHWSFFKRRM